MEPEIRRSPSSIKTLIQIQRENDRGELHGQIRPFHYVDEELDLRKVIQLLN